MQLFSRNKALAALSLGALAALGACGDDVTVPAPVNPPVQVTMSPSNANVNVGSFVDLAVAITGGATTPTLASCATSNAAVATAAVQGGNACRVTGVSAGGVSITATTSGGQTAGASVTVNAPAPAIAGLALTPAAANLQVGSTTNGSVTITANPTTQANASVTLSRAFVSSNNAVATVTSAGVVTAVAPGQATITVTLTGSGTGLATASVTGQVAITVSNNPPAVTGVTVTPQSAVLTTGGTQQLTASAQLAATGIASSITYGTSNPAVATVNASGLVTAVSAGTATVTVTAQSAGNTLFAASSATATVGIVVITPAQISVSSITRTVGSGEVPVDINAVSGQIQVNTNLITNGQTVTAVQAWVCRVGEAVADCATRSGTPAAEQRFGAGGAASGNVTMSINTAEFSTDWTNATVRYNNGQNVVVATVQVAGITSTANSNLAILNFTNTDGFAARHTAPVTTAASAGGLAYFGGPGANGRGSITIVPVTYTAARTITAATATVPAVSGCPATAIAFTGARPWTYSYGYSLGTTTGANATNIVCTAGAGNTLDLTPVVTASTYNDNTTGPTATGAIETGAVANTFRTVTTAAATVSAPASIRVDYAAPAGGAITIPANGWLNASSNLSGGTGSILTVATDANVGLTTTSTVRFVRASGGCSVPTDTTTIANLATSNDIPECVSSNANAVYTAHYYPVDRLGNVGTRVAGSSAFGVDRVAPLVRYATAATPTLAADRAINPTTTDAFRVEALDERSGLTSAPSTSFTRTLRAATSTTGWATASNNFCNGSTAASSGTSAFGTAFISAPVCAFAAASPYSGVTADGYSIGPSVTVAGLPGDGYYTYSARVTDEAGNAALDLARRAILVDASAPAVTATTVIAPITSTFTGPFTGTFIDNVETRGTGLRVDYGALQLAYPMQATSAVAFDDVITRDSLFSGTTPFMSGVRLYTDLEATPAAGVYQGNTGLAQLVGTGVYAQNLGGIGATSTTAAFLTGSITFDNVVWGTKATGAQAINTFAVVPDVASFNSPAGGLKAQVVGPANTFNSPFSRVDFYRQIGATTQWEYVGSVDATATPCISVGQTCNVYIGENASTTQRVITYVLRQGGTSATSTDAIALNSGTYIAIGTTGTSGRGLLSATSAIAPPPPPAFRR
jgi:uncharacterized protein YjdB